MYFLKDFHVTKKKESRDQRKIDGYQTADSHRQEKTEPASYKALSRAELCQREVIAKKKKKTVLFFGRKKNK